MAHRFALLCVMALLLSACDTTQLEIWHTRHLNQEYDAGTRDEVRNFEAYLQLEDRLFKQLEQKIYQDVPTGSGHEIQRYSGGSAADPRQRQPDWNRSFELGTGNTRGGVLLLHGMSDSPYSLRALGQAAAEEGYRVLGLRLPGHGTIPAALTSVKWPDMAAATDLAAAHLRAKLGDAPLHIVGYSNGAALAINYALDVGPEEQPASLVLISPAIGLSRAAALASWKRAMSYIPGLRRLAWSGLAPEFDPYKYNSFATNAAEQVYLLTQHINRRISDDSAAARALPPTLVFKSAVDATVSIDAVIDRFLMHLAPHRHQLVIFDINRQATITSLMRNHPGPITQRLLQDEQLPFGLTLVGNNSRESNAVVAVHKPPFSGRPEQVKELGVAWPNAVFSLSHVALPFPPDDPLYGQTAPEDSGQIYLGHIALQGERGVLALSPTMLLRLRYNPFYAHLQEGALNWIEAANRE